MTTSDPSSGAQLASQPGLDEDSRPSSQQPAADASPPASSAPDSPKDDSGDCAEIPAAAHAVLQADVTLQVRIPRSVDEAQGMPHKLTLTSDDGSVSQVLPIAGAVAGDVDGTSMITFTGLAEHHSYTLQCDNGSSPIYTIFQSQPYENVGEDDVSQDSTQPYGDSGGGDSYDNGINAD